MKQINRDILRLSVPAIVSNVTVPLLGLCDTAISGHLGSEIYLAAIAVGSVMLNVVFWLFGFLRMGTTGLTATAYGGRDERSISQIFSRSLFLAIGGGLLLIVFRKPVMDMLLIIIHAEPEVTEFVRRYFSICIWGAPAALGIMSVSGWFVGMQSTVYPMAIAILVNIVNILLSCIFVFVLGMGFEGVATGTLCANWIGFAIALGCTMWFGRGMRLWCGLKELFRGGGISRFFSVNANLFFRSACIISVSLGVASAGARLGALTLAVNVVVMQLFQFFSFFMDGFAFSAEALVGRYFGASDRGMLWVTVNALLIWTLGMAVLFSILYGVGCVWISELLTDQAEVWKGIAGLRLWIGLIPITSAWAFIYDGFYVGITCTKKMMVATLISTIVFYIIAFLHYEDGGLRFGTGSNYALWSAFLSYLFMRGIILACQWRDVGKTE